MLGDSVTSPSDLSGAVDFRARAFVFGFWVVGDFGVVRVFCPFECIARLSLKFSLGAYVRARLPRVLFSLGRVNTPFCVFIVIFKETVSLGRLFQPALQSSYVETRFPMLGEGRSVRISFHFRLESLCRKTRRSRTGVLWMGLESRDQCFSESPCEVAVR
jgi:hypothetical protein